MKFLNRYREFRDIQSELQEWLSRIFLRGVIDPVAFELCQQRWELIKYRIFKGI